LREKIIPVLVTTKSRCCVCRTAMFVGSNQTAPVELSADEVILNNRFCDYVGGCDWNSEVRRGADHIECSQGTVYGGCTCVQTVHGVI